MHSTIDSSCESGVPNTGAPAGADVGRLKLTIFGATGGIGRLLVEQAVAEGHLVTAVARKPSAMPAGVRAVTLDLSSPDPVLLAEVVTGANVLSALGARSSSDVGIVTQGTRAVVEAMQRVGSRRLVAISAAPVSTTPSPRRPRPPRHDPADGWFTRHLLAPLIKMIFRKVYADLASMEDALEESGLDWTVIRPPRLLDRPVSGKYRTSVGSNVPGGTSIARADVAQLMLRVTLQPETFRQRVGVAY